MTKSELRNIYLAKRKSLTPAERDRASRRIAKNFFSQFDLRTIRTLHCYLAIERFNEIDTTYVIHCVWKNHPQVRVVVPRIDGDEMESILYTADSEVKHNHWLIPEPPDGEVVGAADIGLVLVPLVCSDKRGHRVGYGKGYYDRFLRNVGPECMKIGLSYFDPVERIDDLHEGDVPLDCLITPAQIFHSPRPI